MLCGLLRPSSGTAIVGGIDVTQDPEGVKRRIGYMSQRFSLYEKLTVDQNITFFGGIYGLSKERLADRRAFVLDMAGLRGREHMLTGALSAGWRQRLALGCAILHEPPIVFSMSRPVVSIRCRAGNSGGSSTICLAPASRCSSRRTISTRRSTVIALPSSRLDGLPRTGQSRN
jgi:ABC-type sugar transport system ATPase subunit